MATQRRSKLEYADLANTPNDGRRYELLNGALTVSPSAVPHPNAQYDRVAKARCYATLGVPHYWIVDPNARVIECYRNTDGRFVEVVKTAPTEPVFSHPDFAGLSFDVGSLWGPPVARWD